MVKTRVDVETPTYHGPRIKNMEPQHSKTDQNANKRAVERGVPHRVGDSCKRLEELHKAQLGGTAHGLELVHDARLGQCEAHLGGGRAQHVGLQHAALVQQLHEAIQRHRQQHHHGGILRARRGRDAAQGGPVAEHRHEEVHVAREELCPAPPQSPQSEVFNPSRASRASRARPGDVRCPPPQCTAGLDGTCCGPASPATAPCSASSRNSAAS